MAQYGWIRGLIKPAGRIVIASHRASKDARLSTGYGEAIQG
jgi:hypothetical protein